MSWGNLGLERPLTPFTLHSRDSVSLPSEVAPAPHTGNPNLQENVDCADYFAFHSLLSTTRHCSLPRVTVRCELDIHEMMIEGTVLTQGKLLIMYFYANKKRQNNFHEDGDY